MTAILPTDERPLTWGELLDDLRAAGFCDNTNHEDDEYISPHRWEGENYLGFERWRKLPLYGEGTRWVACYWVVGGSEGYYAHIDEIKPAAASTHRLLAKFWTWERAQEFTNLAQRLVNG